MKKRVVAQDAAAGNGRIVSPPSSIPSTIARTGSIITGFLHALPIADAMVVKLVLPAKLMAVGFNRVIKFYKQMGFAHRCRIAFIPGYLTNEQMFDLSRGTTYYVNTAKAEGSCLPLQDHLAAGRPGVAPVHTAFADYFDQGIGFPLQAHPEPAWWPHDALKRHTTYWNRLVWQSWVDQLRASYDVATGNAPRYAELAGRARERMQGYASSESLALFTKALSSLLPSSRTWRKTAAAAQPLRRAS